MTINRSTILQQLQTQLAMALAEQAEVSLLAKENLAPLINQAQVLIKLVSEQSLENTQKEAHEQRPILHSENHKYRALHLTLTITAIAADVTDLLTSIDNVANSCEQVLLDTEQAVPWQNIHLHKSEFDITEQESQFLATINQFFSVYCFNHPLEESNFPEIKEVYLGQKDSDYHLISSSAIQHVTDLEEAVQELSV